MDWSSQNVVAVAVAPQSDVGFVLSRQSHTNSKPLGYEIALFTPTDHTVQIKGVRSVKYAGGTSLASCIGVKPVHASRPITDLKWNDAGSYLASVDSHGHIGIWSHHKTAGILDFAFHANAESPVLSLVWCEPTSTTRPTYIKDDSVPGLLDFKVMPTLECTPEAGHNVLFGPYAFMALAANLVLNVWVFDGNGKLVRKHVPIKSVSARPDLDTVASIPLANGRVRFAIPSTSQAVTLVDVLMNSTTGEFTSSIHSTVLLEPSRSVVQVHCIDAQRLAIITEHKDAAASGLIEHTLAIWESSEADEAAMVFDEGGIGWKQAVELSNPASHSVLLVGLQDGSVLRLSLDKLADTEVHPIVHGDSAAAAAAATGATVKPHPTTPGSFFQGLQLTGNTPNLDGTGVFGVKTEDGASAANPTPDLDAIFGNPISATPDPSGILDRTSSANSNGVEVFRPGLLHEPPVYPATQRYPIAILPSPNGIHALVAFAALAVPGQEDASIRFDAIMLVPGPVQVAESDPADPSALSPIEALGYALADCIFCAILDNRSFDDVLCSCVSGPPSSWYPQQDHACHVVNNLVVGAQLSVLRILAPIGCAYRNTKALMRLRTVREMFYNAFVSPSSAKDQIELMYLQPSSYSEPHTLHASLAMHKESLHHFVPHALWVIEYCAFLVRHLFIHFNARYRPTPGMTPPAQRPSQWLLLLHRPARRALIECLLLVKLLKLNFAQITAGLTFPKGRPAARANFLLNYVRSIQSSLSTGRRARAVAQPLTAVHNELIVSRFASFFSWPQGIALPPHIPSPNTVIASAGGVASAAATASAGADLQAAMAILTSSTADHRTPYPNTPAASNLARQISALLVFLPGQPDRLELDPIDFALSVPRRPASASALLSSKSAAPAAKDGRAVTPPSAGSAGQDVTMDLVQAVTSPLSAVPPPFALDAHETPGMQHFDIVTGQHLGQCHAIRQCMRCHHFSTPDPWTPKNLSTALDGAKAAMAMAYIDIVCKAPSWSGFYGGCCPCGGRWRVVP
ncbi:hypothetical protein BC831DRAFT_447401 [Entophlyctis helioformis]|nr:hypothetical protein BC831DRAFT_447401 [Entophlyctis helioformis]